MTECYQGVLGFGRVQRRRVEADFSGGEITSDAGVVRLRQADRLTGLTPAMARAIGDPRRRASCDHRLVTLLRQRVYATACGQVRELGSSSTELTLDFDATDVPVHGRQEGYFFHGYYDHHGFLPLYVTCGDQLLVSYLRRSNIDAAKHAWAILSLVAKRLRQSWPKGRIVLRGDSGFCRWRMLRWCEDHDVGYIVGLAKNDRLQEKADHLIRAARDDFQRTATQQRHFWTFHYAAYTWDRLRSVIAKAEHTAQGSNPRFVVTHLEGDGQDLYDRLYCARGEMENRISVWQS